MRFILVLAVFLIGACQQQQDKPESQAKQAAKGPVVPAFLLSDHLGQPYNEQRLRERWTFLFFGFTHCPDVCPLTLGGLARVWDNVGGVVQGRPLQVALVSIDPDRDTPQALADYVARFNPHFVGLRGNMEAVNRLAKPLGIYSERQVHPEHAGHIEVKHSPAVLLIGPDLRVHKLFTPPLDVTAMTDAVKNIEPPVVP